MRFIIALALSLAAAAAAAPQAQAQAQDAGTLTTRQACTVDCACLNEDRTRSWPKTEACCTPSNGGTPDDPYCRHIPLETAEAGFGACCGGGLYECRQAICSK